jgi:hypothetical protein
MGPNKGIFCAVNLLLHSVATLSEQMDTKLQFQFIGAFLKKCLIFCGQRQPKTFDWSWQRSRLLLLAAGVKVMSF